MGWNVPLKCPPQVSIRIRMALPTSDCSRSRGLAAEDHSLSSHLARLLFLCMGSNIVWEKGRFHASIPHHFDQNKKIATGDVSAPFSDPISPYQGLHFSKMLPDYKKNCITCSELNSSEKNTQKEISAETKRLPKLAMK